MAPFDAELAKLWTEASKKEAAADKKMLDKGYKFKTVATVHPKSGDDYQVLLYTIAAPTAAEMGVILNMQEIKPVQMNKRFEFRWFGVESARNAQQVQQQIATMNVLRGIPPEQYEGYKLNMRPIMAQMVDNAFGSRMAPEIFQPSREVLMRSSTRWLSSLPCSSTPWIAVPKIDQTISVTSLSILSSCFLRKSTIRGLLMISVAERCALPLE
jgi:hypothetical protein